MILGIDASNIRHGGGVHHIVELLASADPEHYKFKKVVLWCGSNIANKFIQRDWLEIVVCQELNFSMLHRTWWQIIKLRKLVISSKCDVLFVPGGVCYFKNIPIISMSQSLIPFSWSTICHYIRTPLFIRYIALFVLQSITFMRSDGIIFLTNHSKDAVLRVTGTLQGRTIVIPHGVSQIFYSTSKIHADISEYSKSNPLRLLYVSIVSLYKHQWKVVEAVAHLKAEGIPVFLDLVGASAEGGFKLEKALSKYDPMSEFTKWIGEVPYEKLHEFYVKSDVGIFASSCETFGMILLEKMASGLPIACSNLSSLPETLKDAGVYFDPLNSEDIARAIRLLVNSPRLRSQLSFLAQEKAGQYTWKRCADETFQFLRDASKDNFTRG